MITILDSMYNVAIALLSAFIYPVTGLLDVIVYNIMYTINPVISIFQHLSLAFTLVYNLGVNMFTTIYDTRFVVLLSLILGLNVALRLYSIVHGKTFALSILGNGFTFTFP